MNNVHEHRENQYYLLWPVGILLLLAIGVFVTTREPAHVTIAISLIDIRLGFVFLSLFFVSLLAGLLFFFKKIY